MPAATGDPATMGSIVIRTRAGWLSAPPGRTPATVPVGAILDELGDDTAPADLDPIDPHLHLESVAAFLLAAEGGRLRMGRPDGGETALDRTDVLLLDQVGEAVAVQEIVAAVLDLGAPDGEDVDTLRRRLARLHAAGRLVTVTPPEPEPAAATPDANDSPPVPPETATAPVPAWRRLIGRLRPDTTHTAGPDGPQDRAEATADTGRLHPAVLDAGMGPVTPEPPDRDPFAASAGQVAYLDSPSRGDAPDGAVPVYSVWKADTGPQLSLGMLTAAARAHDGGALTEVFDIRRPEDPTSFLPELVLRQGPAVLLLSNYVWTSAHNLALALRAKQINPELVIIHGGPNTPKYEDDCARFFEDNPTTVDVTVRGEGEVTLPEILATIGPELDLDALAAVPGLTFRRSDGEVVHTGERDRVTDLDALPSPYLTGEFDHLDESCWHSPSGLDAVIIESNRGCPYGCTFCDWGSATLSRIRKFDLDRVEAEMHWLAERHLHWWMVADANFGIMSRDIEFARRLVKVSEKHGFPVGLAFNVAKNTTKHLTQIIGILVDAHITPNFSLSLQTTDQGTLEAIRRENISNDHYVSLAASFRRLGLPLHADLMLGLPGQTVDSFTGDLQFLIDQGMTARVWISVLLPNSPMNDPAYREEFDVRANEVGTVVHTSSFDAADRVEMRRIQDAYVTFERHGLLRLVLRHLQWDHGVAATTVLRRIVDRTASDPDRYPLLAFALDNFHEYRLPLVSWDRFLAEACRFIDAEFGVGPSPVLDAVITAQRLVLPDFGRQFPVSEPVAHDIGQYFRDHTAHLWVNAADVPEPRPLSTYPAAEFTVYGDPLNHCTESLEHHTDPYVETMQSEHWVTGQWELDSPVVFCEPAVAGSGAFRGLDEQKAHWAHLDPPEPPAPRSVPGTDAQRVALSTGTDRA